MSIFINKKFMNSKLNSKLNPKSKNLANVERLPPPAGEVGYHRFHENRLCVKNIDFNFFRDNITEQIKHV